MKRLSIFPALLIVIMIAVGASYRTMPADPQIYAVIVGVSRYNDAEIAVLKYAHRDAEAFAGFLGSSKGGRVAPENIVLLTNEQATRGAIIKGLRQMFNKATDEDVVIFFFSGHGVPDPKITTDLYLITYDTDNENYAGTALLKDDVTRQFSSSKAKLKLFFADACHAGGSGIYLGTKDNDDELVNRLMTKIVSIKEPSWAAITASSSSEKSIEDAKWGGGHGVFTYELIKGLEGAADKTSGQQVSAKGNDDGIVTVRELFDFLSNAIPGETGDRQHPDKQGKNEDAFPVSAVSPDKFAAAVKKHKIPDLPDADGRARDETGMNEKKATGLINKDEIRKFDTETRDMKPSVCFDAGSAAYGNYCFVNNYGEDILLTGFAGDRTADQNLNILIAAGEKVCVERMQVVIGFIGLGSSKPGAYSQNTTFYFRTITEDKPIKYGARKLVLESCKIKTDVLTRQNLYLSEDGPRW
jgi:hypothetical protein